MRRFHVNALSCRLVVLGLLVAGGLGLIVWGAAKAQGPTPTTVSVGISSSSYTVGEADGTVTITVTLSGSSSDTVTVAFATSDGTAIAERDYVAISGTLVFLPETTSQTIVVEIVDNACCDPTQTFSVILSNPQNATLGSPSTATVTILDNDTCE